MNKDLTSAQTMTRQTTPRRSRHEPLAETRGSFEMTANIQDVITSFGSPKPPVKITQEPYHNGPGYLGRLCKSQSSATPSDLHSYAHDLCYQDLQQDLFLYLFPLCLRAWQEDLMKSHESDYAGFVEYFSSAMARHSGFQRLLTATQCDAVTVFMKEAILDKIDQEKELSFSGMRATPYSWMYTIGTFGTVFPCVPQLWEEWWSMPTIGRACGVLQYVSVLMYPDDKNPIFAPWTCDSGGGAPALWETDGFIYENAWLPENVSFLRATLTPLYIQQSISKAAAVLHGNINSTVPEQMACDFQAARVLLELRIEELLQFLSLPLGEVRSWTTD